MLSDDGATGGTDESKAGSDGAVEVGESNAVGNKRQIEFVNNLLFMEMGI